VPPNHISFEDAVAEAVRMEIAKVCAECLAY